MGQSTYSQQTFLYHAVNIYNKLPRKITLIKEPLLFKKWCKKYNLNKNIKLKEQQDHIYNENTNEADDNDDDDRCTDIN